MTENERPNPAAADVSSRSRPFLVALVLLSVVLQGWATTQLSLTGDGAVHLISGHQALRYGQNLVNWEHPPLVKLIMAIPASMASEPLLPPIEAKDTFTAATQLHKEPERMLRATFAGRAAAHLLITVPGLFACFWLGRRFAGVDGGLIVVLLLTLSFSTLGNFSILQTDGGALLGFAGTLCLALRYLDRPGIRRAIALGAMVGVALSAKYSAVLLGPTVLVVFAVASSSIRQRLRDIALAGVAVLAVLLSVYAVANRSITPEANSRVLDQYINNQGSLIAEGELARQSGLLRGIASVSPSASQFVTGFLGIRAQNSIGVYPSFAFGVVSSQGRWWYFPAVFLAKAPLALLAILVVLLPAQIRRIKTISRTDLQVIASLVLVYLLVAVTSKYNLGYRHLLPITPMLLLPLAMALAPRRRLAAALLAVLALESLIVGPLWISHNNTWWLGKHNPTKLSFSGGNLEYAQNFLTLADQLPTNEPIGILIPGKDTPTLQAYMPNAVSIAPGTRALEPGLYAVSVLVEQYVPAVPRSNPALVYGYQGLLDAANSVDVTWQLIQQGEDLGYVADTFHLYRLRQAVSAP